MFQEYKAVSPYDKDNSWSLELKHVFRRMASFSSTVSTEDIIAVNVSS